MPVLAVVWRPAMDIVAGEVFVRGDVVEADKGIRLAALGISSLPMVRPVTGSYIGSEPFSSHCVTWSTVGNVPKRAW